MSTGTPQELPDTLTRQILESVGNALMLIDAVGSILFANSRACALLGKEVHALQGSAFTSLFSSRYRQDIIQYMAAPAVQAVRRLFVLTASDGETPAQLSLSEMPLGTGTAILATLTVVAGDSADDARFRALVNSNYDAIVLYDAAGTILFQAPSTQRILGYTFEERQGNTLLDYVHPDDRPLVAQRLKTAMSQPGVPIYGTNRLRHKNGHYIWTEGTTTNLLDNEHIKAIVGNYGDITARRISEEKVLHASRLYAFISQINHTIVHKKSILHVFDDACRIATEVGNFKMAWIGMLDEPNKSIILVAGSGIPGHYVQRFKNVSYDNNSPQAQALRDGRFVCNNIARDLDMPAWAAFIREQQIESTILFSIRENGRVVGTFNLYSGEKDFFDEEEIRMLTGVADDLSFALGVHAQEASRKNIERKIKHSEQRLAQAQALAHIGNWELDFASGRIFWSEEHCKIYGVPGYNNEHTRASWRQYIHPDDLELTARNINQGINNHDGGRFRHRIILPSGAVRYIYCEFYCEFDKDGIATGLYGISHDITEQHLAEEKIIHLNRLYAFISQINQSIVHAPDRASVFADACRIAIGSGKFLVAWIYLIDEQEMTASLVEQSGILPEDVPLFLSLKYEKSKVLDYVVTTQRSIVCNDIATDPIADSWQGFAASRNWQATMILPILKDDRVYATFNIISDEKGFFNEQESALLEEAAGDIAFALKVFDREAQRKEAEKKLVSSEHRLRQAQSIAHIGSWEFALHTGEGFWSEEACRIYGLHAADDARSFSQWEAYIHPDDAANVKKALHEGLEKKSLMAFYHRIVRADGETRYLYSCAQYDINADGHAVAIQGVAHDVTDTTETEYALAQSEANLRLIMDLIPQYVFARSADGEYLFANKSFAQMYGVSTEQLLGGRIGDFLPIRSESDWYLQQDREIIASGVARDMPEQVFTDQSGNKRIFHTVKVPFTVIGKGIKAIMGISNDITHEKQVETDKIKMVNEIVQRNKDLEQFSYIVSHNLRSPVANISGITEILQHPGLDPADQAHLINEMSLCVSKLDEVIIDLNYVLKVKEKGDQRMERVILAEIVNDVTLSIDAQIRAERATIITDFAAVGELHTRKGYMHSIFINLISNSIKYRQPGADPVITIASRKTDTGIELVFQDNGLGIDLGRRGSQVFGLYKRFHDHVEGKGMGLFMVKTQVESLGGKITISSQVNMGTTFVIRFDI